jgi:RimJ/RimL family protein N-acetyltransferase
MSGDASRPESLLGVRMFGRRVALERLSLRHIPELHAILSSAQLAGRWPMLGNPVPEHELAAYLGSMSRVQFTIVRRESGEPIGLVQVIDEDPRSRTADVALTIDDHLWRAGWPLEAFVLFVDYLFRGLGYRKLYFSMSEEVQRRLGPRAGALLRHECTLTRHLRVGDDFEDLGIFSLHRSQLDPVLVATITGDRAAGRPN